MSTHYKAIARRTNPEIIPVFPLNGAVLLPGCDLPLNIFEPRYLNMIDDALKGDRLIGMIQTDEEDRLHKVGGLGRIIQFSETDDGRYLVVLKGLKRFAWIDEVEGTMPYRRVQARYDDFAEDPDVHVVGNTPEALQADARSRRAALTVAMKSYAKTLGVEVDWEALSEIPLPRLIDQTAMISPFKPDDKQSLLEAGDSESRRRLLIGLMHLYASAPEGPSRSVQ